MTAHTILLNNFAGLLTCFNRNRHFFKGEGVAMVITVLSLHEQFPNQIMRDMAIIANRHVLVPQGRRI